MGIDAYVLQSKDLARGDLYTPIISQSFFKECWMPAINSLDLKWLRVFAIGLDLKKENVPNVIAELQRIKEWGKTNLNEGEYDYMVESIAKLENMLNEAFSYDDVVVFIG